MLLIGDIHIHPRYGDSILQMLRDFVKQNDQESNIIFVGDYVYHFSYHRPSLLALLDFFLELVGEGKQVYVLAGNHDRLGQHFVYAEAEKIMESGNLKGKNGKNDATIDANSPTHQLTNSPNIHFITTPQIITIESEDFFFLPYMLSWKDSEELNNYISDTVEQWENSKSKNNSQLTIIHHYYVAETAFPGLKVKFTYKDLALQPRWLDDERLILISGHIHHAFCYRNYLCVGAVWSTSPVEINQLQYLFVYHPTTKKVTAQHFALNPYLQLELSDGQQINTDFLQSQRQQLITDHKSYFVSSQFDISIYDTDLIADRVTLSLLSNDIQYDQLSTLCDDNLHTSLRDIKLKRKFDTLDLTIEQLTNETQNFSSGRGDRKILLDDYLTQKFGDRKGQYEEMMKEVGV